MILNTNGDCWQNLREVQDEVGWGVTLYRKSVPCVKLPPVINKTEPGVPPVTDPAGNTDPVGTKYTPQGCNPDPNYKIPSSPPPAGKQWPLPCPSPIVEEPLEETQFDTDCESFAFVKTSDANWQEAGLNNIKFTMIWIGQGRANMQKRDFPINHVVYGLPTYYTKANGTIIHLSAGEAARIAAKATDDARDDAYREFRESPYAPTEAEIILFFRKRVNEYMEKKSGTAGVNGTKSSKIIFRDEERSHFSDPYDC